MNILLKRLSAHNFKQLGDVELTFPERGTILIEGQNEAGKSSLFEAVYYALYGLTLTEGGKIEDLRSYGESEMRVRLDFIVDGRPFSIQRQLAQNHTCELTCPSADGATETIRRIRETSTRLRGEIRLSPDALLNTCFVEQKRLERLEDMNPAERHKAINELLNLRILTSLVESFKVTREDEEAITRQRSRVEIAELDAALPELQLQAKTAATCFGFARCLGLEEQIVGFRENIAAADARRSEITKGRSEIAAELDRLTDLQRRLSELRNGLRLRVEAWQRALESLRGANAEHTRLTELEQTLPERERQLDHWDSLLNDLQRLEQLENESSKAQDALGQIEQRLAECDRRSQELEIKDAAIVEAREESTQLQPKLVAAQAEQRERRQAVERLTQLERLEEAMRERARIEADVKEQETRLDDLERRGAELPTLVLRLEELESGASTMLRRTELAAEIERTEERLSQLDDVVRCRDRLRDELEDTERQCEQRDADLVAARLRFEEVGARRDFARLHQALADWAEASEQASAIDIEGGDAAEVKARRSEVEKHAQALQATEKRAVRRALASAGAGTVGIAAGAVIHASIPALASVSIGAGALVAIIALVFLAIAIGAAHSARITAAEVVNEIARINGRIEAIEHQAHQQTSRVEEWRKRTADAAERIEQLGASTPLSVPACRQRLESLPAEVLTEVQTVFDEAQGRLATAEASARSVTEALDNARSRRAEVQDLEPEVTRADLAARRDLLTKDLVEAGSVPLEFGDLDTYNAEIISKRSEVEGARAAADQLRGTESLLATKLALRVDADERCRAAAHRAAAGPDDRAWRAAIETAHDALTTARSAAPDEQLAQRVSELDEMSREIGRRLGELIGEANALRSELERTPRQTIVASREEAQQAFRTAADGAAALRAVRPTLAGESLPLESLPLHGHVSEHRSRLDADRRDVATVPEAAAAVSAAELAESNACKAACRSWTDTLPGRPGPTAPDAAFQELPGIEEQIERAIEMIDRDALGVRDASLSDEDDDLNRHVATQVHQRDVALSQQSEIARVTFDIERFHSAAIARALPMVAQVLADSADEWEALAEAARIEVGEDRRERAAQARRERIADPDLNVTAERKRHADLERDVAVKRRAGKIVDKTRQSIVERVMPRTMSNVGHILPSLTDGRYQRVQWDKDANAITVFDGRSRDYHRKRVFSGGTRDQISLALRLAFALATLPSEHDVRPGWLFLDEPLSSFDRDRTQALVDLITVGGKLRDNFQQIVLISHSESFDPARFDHRVRLEQGAIISSTLANCGL